MRVRQQRVWVQDCVDLVLRVLAMSSETSTFTTDMDTKVPPPKELLTPLDYLPSLGLFGPGPCNPSERVVKAATLPLQHDLTDVFQRVVNEIKAGLQYVFQTRNKYTLAVCGAGHAAMETAIVNVMERGQTIVICVNGFWGTRAREIAERQGNYSILSYHPQPHNSTTLPFPEVLVSHWKDTGYIVK